MSAPLKNCPECLSETPDGAAVCRACGRRIVGKECPECGETSKATALRCAHCGHSFARQARLETFESFSAHAALLPTLIWRGRLIPQDISLSPEKVVIVSWGFFWLSRVDEELPWEKIAGYHYRSGLFWDDVEIQTRGQKANTITGLNKADGARVKAILERMKE